MRTIQRVSLTVNKGKMAKIQNLINARCKEKDHWLLYLHSRPEMTKQFMAVRNAFVAQKYQSAYNLSATHWKNSLQEACNAMDMYWQATFDKIRRTVSRNKNLTDAEKKWAYFVVRQNRQDYKMFKDVRGFIYTPAAGLKDEAKLRKVGNYLNRVISRTVKSLPRVKLFRSMTVDSSLYTVTNMNGKQYLKISGQDKGKPVVIPMAGITMPPKKNKGNYGTVALIVKGDKLCMHYTANLRRKKATGAPVGIDVGYSEVLVDSDGDFYGNQFGEVHTKASDKMSVKGRRYNKLWQLHKKLIEKGEFKKARNIAKFNLGRKKHLAYTEKVKITIENICNQSLNKLWTTKNPSVIVTEDLSSQFSHNSGSRSNRLLSSWKRGTIQNRLEFKSLVRGSNHKQVHSAYSSQMCSQCGYVHKNNRKGDVFKCLNCRHSNHADVVAAKNILSRNSDSGITQYMTTGAVKQVLDERFRRSGESSKPTGTLGTVLTRTPDAVKGQSESE